MSLRLDWCSFQAARYAIENWHYSKTVPTGKSVRIGVWEDGRFIGCVMFGVGAAPNIHKPYGLTRYEVCELVRVALDAHEAPVTQIVSISIKMLKRQSSGLRLIVSYADENEGHLGVIYQAGNWVYEGCTNRERGIMVQGELRHPRALYNTYGTSSISWLRANVDPQAERIYGKPKHKYLYPLDRQMRMQIQQLAKPYPKSDHDDALMVQ